MLDLAVKLKMDQDFYFSLNVFLFLIICSFFIVVYSETFSEESDN